MAQAVELLRHVTAVDPGEYERQTAHNDSAGVRNVAVLVVDLAERQATCPSAPPILQLVHICLDWSCSCTDACHRISIAQYINAHY